MILGALALILMSCLPFQKNQRSMENFDAIVNQWVEGQMEENTGNVIQAPVRRGGWASMDINEDKMVRFNGAMNCGFGTAKVGTWSIDSKSAVLTFVFDKEEGYVNNREGDKEISEHQRYKIAKLTQDALIIVSLDDEEETTWAFLPKANIKH